MRKKLKSIYYLANKDDIKFNSSYLRVEMKKMSIENYRNDVKFNNNLIFLFGKNLAIGFFLRLCGNF